MLYLILTMLAGILIGGILRRKSVKISEEHIIFVPLIFLIFFMGASIGASPDVRDSAILVGYNSLVFAFFTVAGSVSAALFLRRLIHD